jgi:hypothetical protein
MLNDGASIRLSSEERDLESLCRQIEEEIAVKIFVIITTTDLEGYDLDRCAYLIFNQWRSASTRWALHSEDTSTLKVYMFITADLGGDCRSELHAARPGIRTARKQDAYIAGVISTAEEA